MSQQTDTQILAKLISDIPYIRDMFTSREIRWRYYQVKGDKFAYSWTTEPMGGKYFYRKWKIDKKEWKVIEKQEYSMRKEAKEVADYYYEERKKELSI